MLPRYHPPPSVAVTLTRLSNSHISSRPVLLPKSIIRCLALGFLVLMSLGLGWQVVGNAWLRPPPELPSVYYAPYHPPHHRPPTETPNWVSRQDEVRKTFLHAWRGYRNNGFPGDELLPVSGGSTNKYNGWSLTLYDSLDTMWIMGLKNEFNEALENIKHRHFNVSEPDHYVPFFETTIRYLGGLLSAHALSEEPLLAKLAEELGQTLLSAFENTPTGFPAFAVNVQTGQVRSNAGRDTIAFAEAASCQLEFKYLARLTGRKEFYQRVQTVMNVFYEANSTLFHDSWSFKDGTPRGAHFTAGANVDSGYEYLLKQWLQTGDVQARDQYIKSARGIIEKLLYVTPVRRLLYVGDLAKNGFVHRLEHLSCYLGGLLALGASTLPSSVLPPEERQLHDWAAKGLTYTCALIYADQLSGLGPEEVSMPSRVGRNWLRELKKWEKRGKKGPAPGTGEPPPEGNMARRDYWNTWGDSYLLRPETVESLFYMWRTTGDVKWRERGYAIFKAIEDNTRVKYGYSTVFGIDSLPASYRNYMPSWFLAETLKYLYLLFDDSNAVPLDKWVFNTEAHPLPIFQWTAEEKEIFGIVN